MKTPTTAAEFNDIMSEFQEAGMPGCMGSCDATHIVLEKCSARLKNQHSGGKLAHTARAYQITVSHRRQILATTQGFPGRWNDKTIVRFDTYVNAVKNQTPPYNNITYMLKDLDGAEKKFIGAWILVDGGYLNWSATVPPVKVPSSYAQARWSKWAESMRKDVECTFGILKGRWRILKTGIRLHGLEVADDIWYTCCALHNMLLEVDGLNTRWSDGVPSDYEGELGLHDANDVRRHLPPAVFNRLADPRNYDPALQHQVAPQHIQPNQGAEVVADNQRGASISHLSLNGFRNYLVNHFHYEWQNNNIVWPRRNGGVKPRVEGRR